MDTSDDCATGEPGGGDEPYQRSWVYSADGRLQARMEDGAAFGHFYPASGQARPHAPTLVWWGVGANTYQWDDNGNLVERTVDGDTEVFDWDIEQRLATVEGPDGETSFVYDEGGERLLRQTDDGATLYVAGHEISASSDGTTVTGVRTYSFEGELIATRTPDGVDYMAGNEAGSVEMPIEEGESVSGTRSYDPYGQVRAKDRDDFATDRGFVGQIEDSTTDLSYMGARYYDASIAVFISADPIFDTERIKTLNPYAYAAGNPTTFSARAGWNMALGQATTAAERSFQIRELEGQLADLSARYTQKGRIQRNLYSQMDGMVPACGMFCGSGGGNNVWDTIGSGLAKVGSFIKNNSTSLLGCGIGAAEYAPVGATVGGALWGPPGAVGGGIATGAWGCAWGW